jgi:hypothetical protein
MSAALETRPDRAKPYLSREKQHLHHDERAPFLEHDCVWALDPSVVAFHLANFHSCSTIAELLVYSSSSIFFPSHQICCWMDEVHIPRIHFQSNLQHILWTLLAQANHQINAIERELSGILQHFLSSKPQVLVFNRYVGMVFKSSLQPQNSILAIHCTWDFSPDLQSELYLHQP